MSLQFIMATYQSCVQVRQQVGWHLPVTNRFVCTEEFLLKFCLQNTIFSTASHTNSVSLIWFWVTCCSDKILLQRQICTKILRYMRQLNCHATYCHNMLLQIVAKCVSTFKSFGAPSRHPLTWLYTVTMYVEMLKLHVLAASTLMELNDFAENWNERQFSRQIIKCKVMSGINP